MNAISSTALPRRQRIATALTVASFGLTILSLASLAVGWLLPSQRGDWQAVVIWAHLLVTPFASALALWLGVPRGLLRTNHGLLGGWLCLATALALLPLAR
jgi:hypothetical protein